MAQSTENNEEIEDGSGIDAWDLSTNSPSEFVQNLKTAYADGKQKASRRFQILRKRVTSCLETAPWPGPATYTMRCLDVLIVMEPPFNEGLSHLFTSALSHLDNAYKPSEDVIMARKMAAHMFVNAISNANVAARILVKLVVVFGIELKDLGEVVTASEADVDDTYRATEAKAIVSPFILTLVKERSYSSAVALLKQLDLHDCTPQDFLMTLVSEGEPDLAGQWAAHLGVDMSCFLVQQCTEMGMYKVAHRLVQVYKLEQSFPDSFMLYKQSSLRKLASKGLWDVAESIALTNTSLQEYLVNLALEEGDLAQFEEFCQKFNLTDFQPCTVVADTSTKKQYLQLATIMPLDKLFWIDNAEDLGAAMEHLSQSSVVGFDTEWKANHVKGAKENKLASPEMVFVFDLIHLAETEPDALDCCLKTVFHSADILKLGYAVSNDFERLLQSYPRLGCFCNIATVLDLQSFAGRATGGLSGLAKVSLEGFLDKRSRMSDWEKRPLTEKQLHYAALDAVVLLFVFKYLRTHAEDGGELVGRDYRPYVKSFRMSSNKSTNASELEKGHVHKPSAQDEPQPDSELDLISTHLGLFKSENVDVHPNGAIFVRTSTTESRELSKTYLAVQSPSAEDSEILETPYDNMDNATVTSDVQASENEEIVGNVVTATVEDLVSATYELLGQPTPGLLKSTLQEFTQATGLALPIYQTQSWGPQHMRIFRCCVEVAGLQFQGNTAFTKRNAELAAAQIALGFFQDEIQGHGCKLSQEKASLQLRKSKFCGDLASRDVLCDSTSPFLPSRSGALANCPVQTGFQRRANAKLAISLKLWTKAGLHSFTRLFLDARPLILNRLIQSKSYRFQPAFNSGWIIGGMRRSESCTYHLCSDLRNPLKLK